MAEIKMDAEIVASSIHKGDFSKLRGKSFKMCDNKKRRRHTNMGRTKNRITLASIAKDLAELNQKVDNGFKQVNTRLDHVESRLDLVEKRLDYNGLQIEQINKRLDYNNLKKLPTSK